MESYRDRIVDAELDELLSALPAVSIDGPRAVGKTSTGSQYCESVFGLDNPRTLEIVEANPDRVIGQSGAVLIDEWQRMPSIWDLVRRAVDADPSPGRFVLTGSASPSQRPTHSGAGRILSVRMRPLALVERWDAKVFQEPTVSLAELLTGQRSEVGGESEATLEDYVDQIIGGGFPGMRVSSPRAHRAAMSSYVDRLIEVDFAEAGLAIRKPHGLRRWMTAYAAAVSGTASYETVRVAATVGHGDKPSRGATAPYVDTLERLWILDPIPAWAPTKNRLSRLAGGPKHQLVDPALAVSLLEVDAEALLDGRPVGPPLPRDGSLLGALFESLVALNLRVYAQASEARVAHLRKHNGDREVDFIVGKANDRVVAIEVKLSQTVSDKDVRHLHWLRGELGDDLLDSVVVTTGREAYRRADGIAVVPAALLGP